MPNPATLPAGAGAPRVSGALAPALLLCAVLALPAWADGGDGSPLPASARPWSRLDGGPAAAAWAADASPGPLWGPDLGGLELLEAALLPGLNQARHGEWWKAALFVGVEAGVLAVAGKLNSEGDDLDGKFKDYAAEHWSYQRYVGYRQAPGEYGLDEGWVDLAAAGLVSEELAGALDQAAVDALFDGAWAAVVESEHFDASGGRGSHVLPGNHSAGYALGDFDAWNHFTETRTQQYYEMIGKYAQFQRGWDDYGSDRGFEFIGQGQWSVSYFSPGTLRYMDMRSESNDKLIAADRMLGLLIVNHAASFLDALIRRGKGGTRDWRADGAVLRTADGQVPGLRLSWSFR